MQQVLKSGFVFPDANSAAYVRHGASDESCFQNGFSRWRVCLLEECDVDVSFWMRFEVRFVSFRSISLSIKETKDEQSAKYDEEVYHRYND